MLRSLLSALLLAAVVTTAAGQTPPTRIEAVEYYFAAIDHYFITADATEIAALDSGQFPGWVRTGFVIGAMPPGTVATGSTPVCRYLGNPARGLNTHFYSALIEECTVIPQLFPDAWIPESMEVFRAYLPNLQTGACAAGQVPVYRSFNNQSGGNHRYTSDAVEQAKMIAHGSVAEGYGNPPVSLCAPAAVAAPTATPTCTVTTTDANPFIGTSVTLSATCTQNPLWLVWTGCTGAGDTCVATSGTAGARTYSVVAGNNIGSGNPASVTLNWQPAASLVPACTLSASSLTPLTGTSLVLSAACTNSPTGYTWTNCTSTGAACSASAATPGTQTYSVTARNAAGTGPATSVTVNWTTPAPPVCTVSSSNATPTVGGSITLTASCTGAPTSYAWTNCSSTTGTCVAAAAAAGSVNYGVTATNTVGTSAPATVGVTWSPQPPPVCSVSSSNGTPTVGGSITLSASCAGSPTSYAWTNCTSTTSTCVATAATAGAVTYSVTATNAAGTSAPASTAVTWTALPPPTCTLTASTTTPTVGSAITLTAACSGSPSSYAWTNCTSTTNTCTANSAVTGTVTYSMTATNAVGTSTPATVSVTWAPVPPPVPACTLSASSSTPLVGSSITLTATCTNTPTSWLWSVAGCAATSNTCTVTSATTGTAAYTVQGVNAVGTGVAATTSVTWTDPNAGPTLDCPSNPIGVPWGSGDLTPATLGAFGANRIIVLQLTVPANANVNLPNWNGQVQVAEYQGPPTLRRMTLSTRPCDFRTTIDPTGATGVLTWGAGTTAAVSWKLGASQPGYVGLTPGATYYVNIANLAIPEPPDTPYITCNQGSCNAAVNFTWPH